jgi:hypothetical protein
VPAPRLKPRVVTPVCTENLIRVDDVMESPKLADIGLFCFVLAVLASPFKSKLRLQAENAVLRHQLIVLRRRLHGRARFTNHDRRFLIQLYRCFQQSCRFSQSSGPRRALVGTRRAFAATGVGSRAHREGDRRSKRSYAMPRSRSNVGANDDDCQEVYA